MDSYNGKYIPELTKKNYPGFFSPNDSKIMEKQCENVCKIYISKENKGTGFFCKMPFPDSFNLLPVLISNNHVLKEENILVGKTIDFSLNNESKIRSIQIDNSRKTFTNKDYDITIIEIKKSDNLDIDLFLEVDNSYNKDNPQNIYNNQTIYIIHYPFSKTIQYSLGNFKNLENNIDIQHYCATEEGSSGGPLLLLESHKVVGVHKGGSKHFDFNQGTFIKAPIIDFYNNFYNKQSNNDNNDKILLNNSLSIKDNSISKIDEENIDKYTERLPYSLFIEDMIIFEKQINFSIFVINFEKTQICGFLCKIPFPDKNNLLPVLILYDHYYYLHKFNIPKKINFLFNEKIKIIELNESRMIYLENSQKFIAIIEIKNNDGFLDENFLEVDDYIYADNDLEVLKEQDIYLMYFYGKVKKNLSLGIIRYIEEEKIVTNQLFTEKMCTYGYPIFTLFNKKIIGIYDGMETKKKNTSYGILLKYYINKFNIKFNNTKIIGKCNNGFHITSLYNRDKYNHLYPFFFDNFSQIIYQMKYSVCNIYKKGTGFLCIIQNQDDSLPVLCTASFILGEEDKNKEIKLSFDNDKIQKSLILDKTRKIYSGKFVTFIEIKKNDGFHIENFLNIDYNSFSNLNNDDFYKEEPIYLIHYIDFIFSSKPYLSLGKIIEIKDIKIKYYCSTKNGSGGAPIFNLKNNKIIGVHQGRATRPLNYKMGFFLKYPLEELFTLMKSQNTLI